MPFDSKTAELTELLTRLCDGGADLADCDRLESLLLNDPAAQDLYQRFITLDIELAWRAAGRPASSRIDSPSPVAFPPIAPPSSVFASHSTSLGSFAFSYAVAAVIVGAGMLIGWACQVPLVQQIADVPRKIAVPDHSDNLVFVGRVTGIVDCKWADSKTGTVDYAFVPLGRRYALASGLMEITYDSGARVILQGPCIYEVESRDGGRLLLGRVTARIEKNAETDQQRSDRTASKRAKSPPSNRELFAIHTPTAVITDLGTEFGVEVSENGDTETHVFVGHIRVEGRSTAGSVVEQTLTSGQGVQLAAAKGLVFLTTSGEQGFVRRMPTPKSSSIDLIDQIDYADTWSANTSSRAGSHVVLSTPGALRVEQSRGNPPRTWSFSDLSSITTWPSNDRAMSWPGFQVQGSRSGFTETGGSGTCCFGFEYGLRDDFTVQFDAVQSRDRINITIGDKPATTDGDHSLSVFFRPSGSSQPEIGVYTPAKGEVDTGIRSGISSPAQWHNYAVRFNLREKRLTVWVDGVCRGGVELDLITQGMEITSHGNWAAVPWTAQFITVGGKSNDRDGRLWTDNFRVGTPRRGVSGND
jgi:hypothetical protein